MVTLSLTCCGIHMSGLFEAYFVVIQKVLYCKISVYFHVSSSSLVHCSFIQKSGPPAEFVAVTISNPDPIFRESKKGIERANFRLVPI